MSNTAIEYAKMVTLIKDPAVIRDELTADDCSLIHMSMGISGEAGELLDAIKKAVIYRKPLDLLNVIEELGDLEFYLEGLRQQLKITRSEILQANMNKLADRYKGFVYSDKKAIDRADKA